jgi:hypothetical protein
MHGTGIEVPNSPPSRDEGYYLDRGKRKRKETSNLSSNATLLVINLLR